MFQESIPSSERNEKDAPHSSILDLDPPLVVDRALHVLQQCQVQLVEWRAPLYRRMQVPIMTKVYSYAVPDYDLERASTTLLDIRLALSLPSRLQLQTLGDFRAKAHYHRITRSESGFFCQYLALYPLSFTTFSSSELVETPLFLTPSPLCSSVLVPTQPAVYASLIRMILRYPKSSPTRTQLNSDLSELITYNLYGLESGFMDTGDEELCAGLRDDERIANAVALVRRWSLEGCWRVGEEWIGDTLTAIVRGAERTDHSHHTSQIDNSCCLCLVLDGW